jgi:hypothetical protein
VCESGVREDRGGADADAHGSRFPKGAKAEAPPFVFTPGSALLLPPALALTPLGVWQLPAVCARSGAPVVSVHTLLELRLSTRFET